MLEIYRPKVIFVANMGEDSISVIDVNSRNEIDRIVLPPVVGGTVKINRNSKKPRVGPHSLRIDGRMENLYCVNSYDDSISVIDANKHIVKETFFAGSHPNDMALSKDESFAYVTNGDSDCISIIELTSKRIIGQISVGPMPHGVCISPDKEYIYAANMDSDSISIIDTWSNSKVACIKVGKRPIEIISSNDGRYLYVTCSNLGFDENGSVAVMSTANYRVIKNIKVGMIPVQMSLAPNGPYLYVSNMGSDDIYIIDLNRFEVKTRITAGKMARGIIADIDGYIYVTNIQDNNVIVIETEGFKTVDNIEVGIEPTSMLYIH